MSQWGRIHPGLAEHPKFRQVSMAAAGLWMFGNARTRKKRSSGILTHEEALELARGDASLIQELVDVGLWDVGEGRYRYHDYDEHAADEMPKSTAAKIVHDIIPAEHPSLVRTQLAAKVAELLEEGHEVSVLRKALKLWLGKKVSPGFLPHLVSDVVRENSDLEQEWRRAWKAGDLSGLQAHGYVWTPPEIPADMGLQEVRQFMLAAKREWIEANFGRKT